MKNKEKDRNKAKKIIAGLFIGVLVCLSIPYAASFLSKKEISLKGYDFKVKGLNYIPISLVDGNKKFLGYINLKSNKEGHDLFLVAHPDQSFGGHLYGSRSISPNQILWVKTEALPEQWFIDNKRHKILCDDRLVQLFEGVKCFRNKQAKVYFLDGLYIQTEREEDIFEILEIKPRVGSAIF